MTSVETRGQRRLVALVAIAAVALALAIPIGFALAIGAEPYAALIRVYPGELVSASYTAFSVMAEIAAVLTVGSLVHVLFLREVSAKAAVRLPAGADLTILRVSANAFAITTGALVALGMLDTSGVPIETLSDPGALDYAISAASNFTASIVRFTAAIIAAITATLATRWTTLLVSLWGSAIAVITPIAVGQVLVGPAHDLGSDAAYVQAIVAYPLLGVLALYGLLFVAGQPAPKLSWSRLWKFSLVAVPVLVLTDAILAWFKLSGTGITASATGWLIIARWGALLVLLIGLVLAKVGPRRGWLVAALSLLGVAGWIATSIAMTRQPPPQFFVPTTVNEVFLGFNVQIPPTAAVLFTHWRMNFFFVALALFGVISYLVALRVVRRRGIEWPISRTICWLLGWAFLVFVTSSGFGKYSAPHFGIHMIVHMGLSMLVPVLLSLGGVVTLLLRASRPNHAAAGLHEWITWVMGWRVMKVLYNPIVAFAAFISSYYLLYLTGLFGTLMPFHWGHQLMNLHFLVVGYLYYSLIIGVDRAPKPLPHIAKLGMAMAAMPFHAFFGVILMSGNGIIAERFYRYLDIPWADLAAAQELGGGVAWAGGEIPSLIVVIALGIQWARQDRREAKRKDRHFDTGRDTEFEEYNAMLAKLAERGKTDQGQRR